MVDRNEGWVRKGVKWRRLEGVSGVKSGEVVGVVRDNVGDGEGVKVEILEEVRGGGNVSSEREERERGGLRVRWVVVGVKEVSDVFKGGDGEVVGFVGGEGEVGDRSSDDVVLERVEFDSDNLFWFVC